MIFSVLLYASLVAFILGLFYKIFIWFTWNPISLSDSSNSSRRVTLFAKSFISVLFSSRMLILIKTLILEVIFQSRTFRTDRLKWVMHIFIYIGFTMLLCMHALGRIITASLFNDYLPTLNPFFFLRDLFGIFVIVGVGIAFYRRGFGNIPRLKTNLMDSYALAIVALIILSGFFLEGAKMTSHTI